MDPTQVNNWEHDYLNLCAYVLGAGRIQETRVGKAYALYGQSLQVYTPTGKFPLLTTRRIFYRGIFGELAAFLMGATMNRAFVEQGCNYWTPNAKAWSQNRGLADEDLRVGRVYGAQWRRFGGVDQLAEVRRQLKEDRNSRRIILTTWNPAELHDMCLPPCHLLAQFHVDGDEVSCSVYMRSVDLALGLPADVALYYALLVHLAAGAGLKPAGLFFHFGNAHVYEAHREQLIGQLDREVKDPPGYQHLGGGFIADTIQIEDYNHAEAIKYELLV